MTQAFAAEDENLYMDLPSLREFPDAARWACANVRLPQVRQKDATMLINPHYPSAHETLAKYLPRTSRTIVMIVSQSSIGQYKPVHFPPLF